MLHRPTLLDYEYDQLLTQLKQIEATHPDWVVSYSPSLRVGAKPLSEFTKVERKKPMLSLDNTYSKEELIEFHKRICKLLLEVDIKENPRYVVEPKIDGISIELTYKNGVFFFVIMCGDGTIGEDVTSNVKTLRTVPLQLKKPMDLTVRGEIHMEKEAFLSLNEERELQLARVPRGVKQGCSICAGTDPTPASAIRRSAPRAGPHRSG